MANLFRFWKQGDVRHHYDLKQELGKGTFSVVRLGTNKKTGEKVAVKIINKKNTNVETKQMLETEISIMQRVNHPHVIAMRSMYETKTHLFLVMEYVEGGELFDRIVERGCFSEKDAANIISQILEAVKYLHSLGIVHRDLKPENVLCSTKEALDIKIADFGLSKLLDTDRATILQTCCGTPSYAAPELLLCEGYGEPVDVWAVGVILYTLLSGCLPFFGETHSELFERILAGAYAFPDPEWTNISSGAKSLVTALLTASPKTRPTAEQALTHPWLTTALGTSNLSVTKGIGNIVNNNRKASSRSLQERYGTTVTQNVLGPNLFDAAGQYGEEDKSSIIQNPQQRTGLVWDDARDWPLLASHAVVHVYKKDDIILKEGGVNRNYYRIKKGGVRVEKTRHEGKGITLMIMSEGMMFGEISMLQPSGLVSASIRADRDDVEVYQLAATHLKSILEGENELSERFYRELAIKQAQRLSQARQRIEEVLEKEGISAIKPDKRGQFNRTRTASFIAPKTVISLSKIFGIKNDEVCLIMLPCRWKKTLLHAATFYVSQNNIFVAFNFFALKSKQIIPFSAIEGIEGVEKELELRITCSKKQKTVKMMIQFQTKEEYTTALEVTETAWREANPKGVAQASLNASTTAMASSLNLNQLMGQSNEVDQTLSDALTAEDWKRISERSKLYVYDRNQVVIKEGIQTPQNLYQLARGKCRVELSRPEDDSTQIIGTIQSGETFGEISFLQNSRTTASVVADDTQVEVYVIEGDDLNDLFNEYPAMPGRFYKYLATLISNRLHNREIEILS